MISWSNKRHKGFLSLVTVACVAVGLFSQAYAAVECPPGSQGSEAETVNLGTVYSNPYQVCQTYEYQQCFELSLGVSSGAFSVEHTLNFYDPAAPSCRFTFENTYVGTLVAPTVGYINPKYVVLGVTYAAPGGTASNVAYTSSTTSSSTASLQQSFSSAASYSVSANIGLNIPLVGNGTITATTTTTATQTNTSLDSATITYVTTTSEKTNGVPNTFLPVDHDYDIVWVWLNPALIFSLAGNGVVTWDGYGVDTTDPEASGEMDVQALYLGYLNGNFAMPADLSPTGSETPLSRWWASPSLYTYASGDSPALSSADLANIASADPFYNNQNALSSSSTTYNANRYTLSNCGSFNYQQPSPGTYSCTDVYTSSATQTDTALNSFQVKFSISDKVQANFFDVFQGGGTLSASQTLTWTTTTSSSATNSLSTTAALSVNQGPTCTGSPCNPLYPAQPTEPAEFTVYQDNAYGTFLFQPTVYNGPWVGADGNTP